MRSVSREDAKRRAGGEAAAGHGPGLHAVVWGGDVRVAVVDGGAAAVGEVRVSDETDRQSKRELEHVVGNLAGRQHVTADALASFFAAAHGSLHRMYRLMDPASRRR